MLPIVSPSRAGHSNGSSRPVGFGSCTRVRAGRQSPSRSSGPTSRPWSVRHDVRVARRGRRGAGTTYYSKADRRWIARYPLGIINGKRASKRVKCRTEPEAIRELEKLVRAYGSGGNPARQTLDAYLTEWLEAHGRSVKPSTFISYRGHVRKHISPLLGGIIVASLKPSDVRRLITQLERKGLAPATIGLVITTLRIALNVALADRDIPDNPAARVPLPRVEREPVRPLHAFEADAILEAVTGSWIEWPVRVWLGSGLRRGEVLGLDQKDLALDAGFVRVRVSKTYVRAVPVSDDAVSALREAVQTAPRRGPNEPVFYAPRAKGRMRGDSVTHLLPRLLDQVGIGHLTPHALRHGAATLMLAAGNPMRVISEQLGHKNPALTARIYAHVIPEAQRSAIGSLERRRRA